MANGDRPVSYTHLHPLDVRTLLGVFRTLIENVATVIVIDHDLDVIRSADYIIDRCV